MKQIYEIGLLKKADSSLANIELEQLCKCIAGSCASMGIEVVSGNE